MIYRAFQRDQSLKIFQFCIHFLFTVANPEHHFFQKGGLLNFWKFRAFFSFFWSCTQKLSKSFYWGGIKKFIKFMTFLALTSNNSGENSKRFKIWQLLTRAHWHPMLLKVKSIQHVNLIFETNQFDLICLLIWTFLNQTWPFLGKGITLTDFWKIR